MPPPRGGLLVALSGSGRPHWRVWDYALPGLYDDGAIDFPSPGSHIGWYTVVIGYLGLYAWRLPVIYQHGRYVIPAMRFCTWVAV
jgi:hypothetical protein